MTIAAAKRALADALNHAGIETPDLDARFIIMAATDFERSDIIARGSETVMDDESDRLQAYLKRRIAGEPIDSILGFCEFYGRRFDISEDVLSPRPETEGLIDIARDSFTLNDSKRVLDLGTGSGAILVTLLAEVPDAHGVGADISPAALSIAGANAKRHGVSERCEWVESDWFSSVNGLFDMIVSNPPYITDAAMTELSPEVVGFDPDLALRGGPDGLAAYRAILADIKVHLKPGGTLVVEIGWDQGSTVPALMEAARLTEIIVHKDLSGHDRLVSGRMPRH